MTVNRLMSKLGTQTPAPGGGGGGGAVLSNVLYVDGGNAQSSPDGSIGNPFPTVQEALDAGAAGSGSDFLGVLVSPGDYRGETLTYAGSRYLSIAALDQRARVTESQCGTMIGPLTSSGGAWLNGLQVQSVDGGYMGVWMQNCDTYAGAPVLITCGGGVIYADNCMLWQTVTVEGSNAVVRNSELRGVTFHATGGRVDVTNSYWTVGGAVNFDIDYPSFLRLDPFTLWHWQQMGLAASITGGALLPMVPT